MYVAVDPSLVTSLPHNPRCLGSGCGYPHGTCGRHPPGQRYPQLGADLRGYDATQRRGHHQTQGEAQRGRHTGEWVVVSVSQLYLPVLGGEQSNCSQIC